MEIEVILVLFVLVNLEGKIDQKETFQDHKFDFWGIISLLNTKKSRQRIPLCAQQ